MRFGLAEVTTLSHATPPDSLGVRALNPGPLGILGRELGSLLGSVANLFFREFWTLQLIEFLIPGFRI
jgi:hypothetical protein